MTTDETNAHERYDGDEPSDDRPELHSYQKDGHCVLSEPNVFGAWISIPEDSPHLHEVSR